MKNFPTINDQLLETNGQIALVTRTEDYQFISCGRPVKSSVDFGPYISPYDTSTWISIFVFFVSASLTLAFSAKTKIIDGLFGGICVLFDQGQGILVNVKASHVVYYLNGAWILMAITIKNAYKGENINKLVSPIGKIPYENLSQLVNDGFQFFSSEYYIQIEIPGERIHAGGTDSEISILFSGINNWDPEFSITWRGCVENIMKGLK